MAHMDVALKDMMLLDGAIGAAVVDYDSGMPLGIRSNSQIMDIEPAAAGSTELIRAKMRTMEHLGLDQEIEDVLITLTRHHHLLRPANGPQSKGLFLYLVLDRDRGNLALARHRLKHIAEHFEI
ncbi:hypothetical protein BJY24_005508 [Nocardia transvalensis]|uniref:Roadblock/LAMTOR2 domain-containing protein n=1 Tax=Nocardia transvalensis TaxID=37333 RepID=A0A7W9PI92_9NOCA|nr:hypothetical protein [Nocardia transvalensis]MBB5916596.1 hypothetical protein [Nocardia transvalensis]